MGRGPLSTHPAPYRLLHLLSFSAASGSGLLLFPSLQTSSSLSLGMHTLISATIILEALYVLNYQAFSWVFCASGYCFQTLDQKSSGFFSPCSADWSCELIFDGSMLERMNVIYLPGYSNPVTENGRQILESSQESCGLGIHCPVATWWPEAHSPDMTPVWATEAIRVESSCLYGFKACYAFYPGSGQSSRSSRGTNSGNTYRQGPCRDGI